MIEPTQESAMNRSSAEDAARRSRTLPSFRIALRPTNHEITQVRRIAESRARAHSLSFIQSPTTFLEIVTPEEADMYLRKIVDPVHLRDLGDEVLTRSYHVGRLQGNLVRQWRTLLHESGSATRVDVPLPLIGVGFESEGANSGRPGTKISLLMGDYRSDEEAAPVLDAVNRTFGGENSGESRLTAQRLSLPIGFVATDEQTARNILENPLGRQFTRILPFMAPSIERIEMPQQS